MRKNRSSIEKHAYLILKREYYYHLEEYRFIRNYVASILKSFLHTGQFIVVASRVASDVDLIYHNRVCGITAIVNNYEFTGERERVMIFERRIMSRRKLGFTITEDASLEQ